MSVVQNAIQTYHALLTPEAAQDSQAHLDDQMNLRGLFFGDRPLTTVLRPRFLSLEQYRYIRHRTQVLLQAFGKIHEMGLKDKIFREQFMLLDWEHVLVEHDPGFHTPTPISRLDSFYIPETNELRFTEYNAETPAAPAYNDVLTAVFFGLPVMRDFLRRYVLYTLPARHGALHALMDAYQQWAGRGEKPRVAIIDWSDVPTYSEFLLFQSYFKAQGLECIITSPQKVEYIGGKLMAGDFHINLIFKRVLISELIEQGGLEHPIVRAVLDNAVCMANPFNCKMLYKKASLAVLSDERNAYLFNAEETKAIADHIPWTRKVEYRTTLHNGKPVDLIPYIVQNKDRLVLKPNDDYGGRGIVLGWTVDYREWEQAIKVALETPYIVQERINIPSEPYPSMIDNQLHIFDRMLDTAPFAFHGDTVYGCLTRLSTSALLNVTAGGGSTVPTFLVEER